MTFLKHTLVSDGPTDVNLIPIIDWTLKNAADVKLSQGTLAEFWRLPDPPKGLEERMSKAMELFPCDVLFIHRDAEKEDPEKRYEEIRTAIESLANSGCKLPAIAIVPVRMTEAWLLFNEGAIRSAAGNPNGKTELHLPAINRLESLADPKEKLQEALMSASELTGRRLKKFNVVQAFRRVVDFLDDYSPLRQLSAYLAFENAVREMKTNKWSAGFYFDKLKGQ